MVLSKRERYIALGASAAIGIMALDYFALTPLLSEKQRLDGEVARVTKQLRDERRTIQLARTNNARFQEMKKSGLNRQDASQAESEVMKEIRNWAQQAGVGLSLLKADRSEKDKVFQKSTIRVTASGAMSQVSHFLWYIQTADIPIQFTDVQLNVRKEGTDDLTLQLTLGTIIINPENNDSGPPPAVSTQTAEVTP